MRWGCICWSFSLTSLGGEHWPTATFDYFNRTRPCPWCAVPLTIHLLVGRVAHEMVHGETPILCWPETLMPDFWKVTAVVRSAFYNDWRRAIIDAHWKPE